MWNKVGIVRTEASLLDALSELNKIEQQEIFKDKCNSIEEYELRNMLYVAKCIINSALKRKESIGAHYRADSETKDIKQHGIHRSCSCADHDNAYWNVYILSLYGTDKNRNER